MLSEFTEAPYNFCIRILQNGSYGTVNLQTEQTQYEPPKTETAWSRIKKALGPVAVVGVVIAKFFAKLKFVLLPLLKFLPLLLKSGGTMVLMIWVYTQLWGWQFALGFVLLLLVHESGHLLVAKKFWSLKNLGSRSVLLFLFPLWARSSR